MCAWWSYTGSPTGLLGKLSLVVGECLTQRDSNRTGRERSCNTLSLGLSLHQPEERGEKIIQRIRSIKDLQLRFHI